MTVLPGQLHCLTLALAFDSENFKLFICNFLTAQKAHLLRTS